MGHDDAAGHEAPSWPGGYQIEATLDQQPHALTQRAVRLRDGRRVLLRSTRVSPRHRELAQGALILESELLQRVDHPNIVTLLDVIRSDGRVALVLEDHGGHRLDGVLDRLPQVEPLTAVAIAIEVGRALAALHHMGEAHGLLRAGLVELGEQGQVYLHGVGQRLRGAAARLGDGLEIPENMAPEQILGDEPDAQTDVFLVGMLLYRMVAGHAPFEADEGGVSQHIRHSHAPSLSRQIRHLPSGLNKVVARCLQKRARDRYLDMGSVVGELMRVRGAQSSLPSEVLVSRTLAGAGLADEIAAPREHGLELGTGERVRWLQRMAAPAAIGLAALLVAVLLWRGLSTEPVSGGADPRGIVKRPAQLRVLARPWAEVHLDGKLIDVTPVGRPIEVSPGPHTVVFRHPNAPEESRTVEIIAGQTILLDVEMRVVRPPDASVPEAAASIDDP